MTQTLSPFVSSYPFETERIGAAAVYCSDGRYGEQMDDFLHKGLGLPRYDRVAIPGGAAALAGHMLAMRERSALERQLRFLTESHELTPIVLIAHTDCVFYRHNVHPYKLKQTPLQEFQFDDLAKAAELIHSWNTKAQVDAFFANRRDAEVRFDPVAI